MTKQHIGSDFDDFLAEEALLDETTVTAAKRVIACTENTTPEERRAEFDAQADERYARVVASGKTTTWKEMRRYLEARLAGKAVKRPACHHA
jgi:hypothetical protein